MPDKIPMGMLGQNQNLINPIKIERITSDGTTARIYRSIILDVVGLLAAFFAGYSYFQFLGRSWSIVAAVGAFLLFVAVFAIQTLLGKRVWRQIVVILLQAVVFLLPFYLFDRTVLAVTAGVMFLFFLIGYGSGRSEINHGTTVRFFRATHGSVANAVTGLILAGIILYLPMANAGSFFVGESSFTGFFNWAAGVFGGFYPAISFTGSFGSFAESVAKDQLAAAPSYAMLPPTAQNAALTAAADQIETSFSRSTGITPSSTSPMSDVVYHATLNLLESWRSRFSVWFTAAWGIAVFFIFRSIGVVAVWIGQFIAMIIYETLLSLGIVRIKQEPQTREVLDF
jgi:hypothetical protein